MVQNILNMAKKITIVFWGSLAVFIFWLLFLSNSGKKPAYIREEFNNGKVIEMPVDDSVTSGNWRCTGDCSGHEAGYDWAKEKGITDPGDCGGKSRSFIEGCEAYANEQ